MLTAPGTTPGGKRVTALMEALGVKDFAAKPMAQATDDLADKLVELCVFRGITIQDELWERST